MKLSKTQQNVIDLMENGWELGCSIGLRNYDGRCWLQKGGLGRGGETKNVGTNTVHALYNKGFIQEHYKFPTTKYTLKEEQ